MFGENAGMATVPQAAIYVTVGVAVVAVILAAFIARYWAERGLARRLNRMETRLGIVPRHDDQNINDVLSHLAKVTEEATHAVEESSEDARRLRCSLDTFPQGVVLCDENAKVVYRNVRAASLMTSRHGDALAAQAVTELLEKTWHDGSAERTIDLYGPPRRTLTVRARLIDQGQHPLGAIAIIEDVSERRRLEEIRRDFVANVSHELKTPMGALGLLAETLVSEPDVEVAQRLAGRIHAEAFRVSRIIDDLLDLTRIESEATPPRDPVAMNAVMAEAVERVRTTAEQRGISILVQEPDPPVSVLGDRRQLVSALHALLENAVTYSYDNSKVWLTGTVVGARDLTRGGDGPSPGMLTQTHAATAIGNRTVANRLIGPADHAAIDHPAGDRPLSAKKPGSEGPRVESPAITADDVDRPSDADGEAGRLGDTDEAQADHPGGDAPEASVANSGMVRLSVSDHGVGIPARELERIFERFYRVDHGRSRDTGGTGLGLSIVRHVASNHQGWVDVESREGEGSSFTLVLPLHSDGT